MPEIPVGVYLEEHGYMRRLGGTQVYYGDLLPRFEGCSQEVTDALQRVHAVALARGARKVLDPDELDEIRDKQPDVYERILPTYTEFLKEKASLT